MAECQVARILWPVVRFPQFEFRPDGAIRVAPSGVPLMMALRVTSEEQSCYDAVVRPLTDSTRNLVKFIGEVGGAEKDELIGHAGAAIFPFQWEEPFGLARPRRRRHVVRRWPRLRGGRRGNSSLMASRESSAATRRRWPDLSRGQSSMTRGPAGRTLSHFSVGIGSRNAFCPSSSR